MFTEIKGSNKFVMETGFVRFCDTTWFRNVLSSNMNWCNKYFEGQKGANMLKSQSPYQVGGGGGGIGND